MCAKVIFSGNLVGKSVNNFKLLAGESSDKAIFVTIDEPFNIDMKTFARVKEIVERDKKITECFCKKRNILAK